MKKNFWKIEYSITLIVFFTIVLFMIPTSFNSKNALYISKWNETYNKIDYMFTAMSAQADSDIARGIKNAKTNQQREFYMIQLVKTYLRLNEQNKLSKKYTQHYMNGIEVNKKDFYYFNNLYISESEKIVGIKDINNTGPTEPGFVMLIDMNGIKKPNTWGKDIYGINIYSDGKIKPLGYGWDVQKFKKDCSDKGTGISCSHYYRIGGEFTE